MKTKTEITIKLSEETASFYYDISEVEQQKIQLKIKEIIIQELAKIQPKSQDTLGQLMDEISKKAIARGLTPEILEEILNEDD